MPDVVAIVEARMTSSRLPGKVLLPAAGKPLLEHLIERLRRVPSLDGIVVATTRNETDQPIVELTHRLGVGCFRGSEEDVLQRVLEAAQAHQVEVIVEITGDCPAIDPQIVEACIAAYRATGADFVSNVLTPTYPWGMDTKVFATQVLDEVARLTQNPADREHVSLFIYRHPERYRLHNVIAPPHLRWPELHIELDALEDYQLFTALFEALYPDNPAFTLCDTMQFLRAHPEVARINEQVPRKAVCETA